MAPLLHHFPQLIYVHAHIYARLSFFFIEESLAFSLEAGSEGVLHKVYLTSQSHMTNLRRLKNVSLYPLDHT